jgi:hypothetical protein
MPTLTGPDPTAFLAAIAGTSAAMVAITGGLLVARFVTIASEQDGADKLVQDATERLATAQRRLEKAREKLHNWDLRDFFQPKVIRAIKDGEHNLFALRKLADPTALTHDEIYEGFRIIHTELRRAKSALEKLFADNPVQEDYLEWEDFRHVHASSLPEIEWDDVWEIVYIGILEGPDQEASASRSVYDNPALALVAAAPYFTVSTPPEYVALDAQRRDAIFADLAKAEQRLEDIEDELGRLTRERDAIGRPKGLGSGLAVLGFFTVVGIIVPLWIMSRGPDRLTAHLGEVVFWLFFAGLLGLLGHMSWLALRLSVARRKSKEQKG